MQRRKNKNLKTFYSAVYKNGGGKKHYTTSIFSKNKKLPEEHQAVLAAFPSWKGKTVVDVGCGTGRVPFEIAKRGAKYVLGIDYADSAIDEAKRNCSRLNLEFRAMDVKNLRGKYDAVLSVGALEHMDNPLTLMKRLKRHVKPGGSLIITCPNWVNPRGYFLQTLRLLFKAPITLADLHYLTPIEFQKMSRILKMPLAWKTVDHDWAHGHLLIRDFKRRIPNVLRGANLPTDQNQINLFIKWIKNHVLPFNHKTSYSGATALYHFKKPR